MSRHFNDTRRDTRRPARPPWTTGADGNRSEIFVLPDHVAKRIAEANKSKGRPSFLGKIAAYFRPLIKQ